MSDTLCGLCKQGVAGSSPASSTRQNMPVKISYQSARANSVPLGLPGRLDLTVKATPQAAPRGRRRSFRDRCFPGRHRPGGHPDSPVATGRCGPGCASPGGHQRGGDPRCQSGGRYRRSAAFPGIRAAAGRGRTGGSVRPAGRPGHQPSSHRVILGHAAIKPERHSMSPAGPESGCTLSRFNGHTVWAAPSNWRPGP
jgi:hypothetical protein